MAVSEKHPEPIIIKKYANRRLYNTDSSSYNTLEHLALFLPGIWLFSFAVSPLWAAAIGMLWPIGRLGYALGYYKSAQARSMGLLVSMPPIYIFVLGSLIGFVMQALQTI